MARVRNFLTALVLLGELAYLLRVYPALPAIVPSHFNAAGQVNGHASRGIVWVIFAISIFMALFLSIVERFPHAFNLPRPVGDPGRPRLEAIAIEMLGWLRLEIALLFASTLWAIVHVAQGGTGGLGGSFILVFTAILLTVAYFLYRIIKPAPAA